MPLVLALHDAAVIVVFTPGPVTVQEVVMPVPVTVIVLEPPDEMRVGFAVIETVGLEQVEGGATGSVHAGYVPIFPISAQVGDGAE